jgi:indoleamine 2,3-dioxygenase
VKLSFLLQMALKLADFGVSPDTGFIPKQAPAPLSAECFSQWERVAKELPQLIKTKKLRESVNSLSEIECSDSTLKSEDEWKRAYVILSYIGQGYIWMSCKEDVAKKVPKILAVPWAAVSERLGMKPVINYAATVLYNYRLKDPAKPIALDNLHGLLSFTGSEDESWLFMVHVAVEVAAGPGLDAVVRTFQHMAAGDNASICESLKVVQSSINSMKNKMIKMYDGCSPHFFYNSIRDFVEGSMGHDEIPYGLVYEGVDSKPRKYRRESGAQSSSVYAFDIFLGTEHTDPERREFLIEMKQYMPKKHRDFLKELSMMPSIREYCKNAGQPDLTAHYNDTAKALYSFRQAHVGIVRTYLVKASVNKEAIGSGDSTIQPFLNGMKGDTEVLKMAS